MAEEKTSKGKKLLTNALIGLGAFTVASFAANTAINAAYNNISYEFVGAQFNFNQLMLGRVGVNVTFKIKNGNAVGCTVTSIEGKVSYGNLKLADVNAPLPIVVPANGEATGTVNLSLIAMTFINDIIQAFSNGSGVYSTLVNVLKFKGLLKTNIINIPLEFNIPVTVG